jgi:hypothetical protein
MAYVLRYVLIPIILSNQLVSVLGALMLVLLVQDRQMEMDVLRVLIVGSQMVLSVSSVMKSAVFVLILRFVKSVIMVISIMMKLHAPQYAQTNSSRTAPPTPVTPATPDAPHATPKTSAQHANPDTTSLQKPLAQSAVITALTALITYA